MNVELISQLRNITNAGMSDCSSALKEAGGDLQQAIDIIKIKGQAISDARSAKPATEGVIGMASSPDQRKQVAVEINTQTDFVSRNPVFIKFVNHVAQVYLDQGDSFSAESVEIARQEVSASTKENIVVRRWWALEAPVNVRLFSYLHSNNKIGVLLSLQASETILHQPEFQQLGEDLTMQICAMNPLAVEALYLPTDERERQKAIFESQLKEENKPPAMWDKILLGKMARWHKDVCLLEQESITVPKTSVKKVITDLETKLGGSIAVVSFIRAEVGEGLVKKIDNLAQEVGKLL